MSHPLKIWLVHPSDEMCLAFRERFDGLPGVSVVQSAFEELRPHDCFVTAGNPFSYGNGTTHRGVIKAPT